ncbi:MAG TPA: DUF1015 domain-containing protein [Thermoanaerobaculia bacterium]|nr:DUF1015 domain-containing protein [Thermoanaerobaculia bacterium]
MKILAFQGYRYAAAAGNAEPLAAPPFDQIDDRRQRELHAASPHQFAHLTRPTGEGVAAALRSSESHAAWIASGVVMRDQEPALYPYAISLPEGGRRLGLCCLVGVDHGQAGDLRPHEHTVDKPLADRLALLEATRVDYEPVFLLADDDGSFERALAEEVERLQPVARHTDPLRGDHHVIYRLDDPARVRRFQTLLASRGATIADGHHRTKVAQLFASRHQVPPGTAAAAKLAVLTSVTSPGLTIDPIHRAVQASLSQEVLAGLAVRRTSLPDARDGATVARAVDSAAQPSVGVRFAGAPPEIWLLDPNAVPANTPGREAGLAVVALHHQLLAAALGPNAASDGTVVYKADPDAIWQQVTDGEATAGFWLPSMSPESFALATRDGSVLPPKSTRFLPKLVSGLVWCGHDARTA